ncbi:hypothetical protein NQ318_008374 [Aromia moschata]|uniref:Uncharacterized protein n=1 Tax=Aromia moschata TaxID=1265417 RepID=A0AAV8YJ22_9CUCU|nr:hypothetical protein NQ318_008374 [Aromia moschata]
MGNVVQNISELEILDDGEVGGAALFHPGIFVFTFVVSPRTLTESCDLAIQELNNTALNWQVQYSLPSKALQDKLK